MILFIVLKFVHLFPSKRYIFSTTLKAIKMHIAPIIAHVLQQFRGCFCLFPLTKRPGLV